MKKDDENWTLEFINEPPEEQLDFIRYLALSKVAKESYENRTVDSSKKE